MLVGFIPSLGFRVGKQLLLLCRVVGDRGECQHGQHDKADEAEKPDQNVRPCEFSGDPSDDHPHSEAKAAQQPLPD